MYDSFFFPGIVLVIAAAGMTYFKVPIPKGIRIINGVVPDTFEKVGLRAVCAGPDRCGANSKTCLVTPPSSSCGNPMKFLSKFLCNTASPQRCGPMDGLFNFMGGNHKPCGVVDHKWCHFHINYISGSPKILFAFCVKY